MKRLLPLLLASFLLLPGCGDDDGGPRTQGTIVCVGDSLTAGIKCIGPSYPTRLAAMSGRPVVNLGVGGATTRDGPARVQKAFSYNPGVICILYGSNDPGHHVSLESSLANIRAMARACKARGVPAVLATPPPTMRPHQNRNDRLAEISAGIKAIAKEMGFQVVDLNAAVGADREKYLNPEDGLHLSDAGGDLFAKKFDSKL